MTKVWEFPQGTVEKNEDPLETLRREVAEETGIIRFQLIKDFQTKTHYRFKRGGTVFDKTVTYYLGLTDSRVHLSEEHEYYRWCTANEASKLFKHKNHKDVLEVARKTLKSFKAKI